MMYALVVDGRSVTEPRVAAVRVVPSFDPLEDGHLRLGLGSEPSTVEQLALEGGEEALGHRIVVGIADRAHPGHDARFPAALAEGVTRVLRPVVRMVNDAAGLAL